MFNLNAQEKSDKSLRIEPGILILSDSEDLGLILNVEPNIRISEKIVIGLRIGISTNSQKFEKNGDSQFNIDDESDSGVISFLPTFDYYLNENNLRPYLGLGLGFCLLSDVDVFPINSTDVLEVNINNQFGFLLRGGLELGNTRLGIEYNFIPKADIKVPNAPTIGTVDTSYFGLSIGFAIGGRKI